ncbi:MAG: AraC family transcriptional regulator [Ruminococcaceae bacterium]|nr:AraC family transcriptional regulator [Oscillospiraceae bacterium]
MNNTQFSNSFKFRVYRFEKYRHTDMRSGAEYHFVACLRKGRCRIVTKSQTLDLQPGDVFYIPKNLPYQSYWQGDPAIEFASYGFHYFPNAEARVYPLQKIQATPEDMERIDRVIQNGEYCSGAIFRFYELLSRLLPGMTYIAQNNREALLIKAEQRLRENPHISMGELAKFCGISESGLYMAFKRSADCTPNEMRQRVLLERATELLEQTNLSVEQISDMLRFSSSSYFRKILKQHTGLTPTQIRKGSSM